MQFTAIGWNLFHGRDFPPDHTLFTWRSRLLRITERNATHVQVNRDLFPEFSAVLSRTEWDVALLQECPPRWARRLAAACRAECQRALTSRNSLGTLRSCAGRVNPDLIASAEGGSNVILVRSAGALGAIVERRAMVIHEAAPERRSMGFAQTSAGICVANLHATNDVPALAAEDVLLAAESATTWAAGAPLLFGGDLNLRPGEDPAVFEELAQRFGLAGVTAPDAIDHLLVRGLDVAGPPRRWPAERRELPEEGRALRLSDHAPVEGRFASAERE